MTRVVSIAAASCLAVLWSSSAAAQAPTPVEPIAAILEAFKTHSLVAMSDAHGNALYQDVADRYVRGEDVPYTEIRQIWENTVVQTGGNSYLMIEELFRVVRDVNRERPPQSRLRILLGGHLHFQRKNIFSNFVMDYWQAQTLISLIETATATKVFTIWQLDLESISVETSKWPVPSIVTVRGTEIGTTDVAVFRAPPGRFTIQEGKMVPIPQAQWRSLRTENQFDAILYLGSAAAMKNRRSHEIPPALCSEPGFLARQLQRMALSAPPPEIEQLKLYCTEMRAK